MGKVTRFFLGSNSEHGFHSLYDNFASGAEDFLYIIKAGPGTGKSTFMRKIGKAAEEKGYDVEYILCSGDPDSLDGVYIPALHVGWADGTAPHVMDPVYFGADGAYLDLGRFCDTKGVRTHRKEITDLTQRYRGEYAKAYAYTAAAGRVDNVVCDGFFSREILEKVKKRANSAIRREFGTKHAGTPGEVVKRFLSAVSCKGKVFLADTLKPLCQRVYLVENQCGLAESYLQIILEAGLASGANALLCPTPLRPNALEAVLFPELGVGFIADAPGQTIPGVEEKWVHLDAIPNKDFIRANRALLRTQAKEKAALVDTAQNYLRRAKALHDELEAYYRPYLDIDRLNSFTERHIDGIL